jgi:hypothetical protein
MSFSSMQAVYDALPGQRATLWGAINMGLSAGIWVTAQIFANLVPGGAFAAPAAAPGATCDRTKAGALSLPADPGGGRVFRVARARAKVEPSSPQLWLVNDRLVECALDASLTSVQTLNTVALPARAPAGGLGVQMAFESGAALGANVTATVSIAYTNEQGVAATTTFAMPYTWNQLSKGARTPPLPLAAGDQGVRSVQSVQITTPGTLAGNNLYLVLSAPILLLDGNWRQDSAGRGGEQEDWFDAALAAVDPNACLEAVTTNTLSLSWGMELDLVID